MIRAILYDLDGVLVHAVKIHYDAFNLALKEVTGKSIDKDEEEDFNGLPTKDKLDKLEKYGRVQKEQKQVIWNKKQEKTIQAIRNNLSYDCSKVDLHIFTRGLGLKSVCVTNSITETAKLMLKQSGQWPHMQFLISNQMVNNPKPHGEGYIRAMIRLGLEPNEVLIVEDSNRGIKAAKSTGAHIWHVKNSFEVNVVGFKKRLAEFDKLYERNLISRKLKEDKENNV